MHASLKPSIRSAVNSLCQASFIALLLVAAEQTVAPNSVSAQNNSLFQNPQPAFITPQQGSQIPGRAPVNYDPAKMATSPNPMLQGLSSASWTLQQTAQQRVWRVHEIISIRVDETARMIAEGRASQRKNALYDGVLQQWLDIVGWDTVKPATQANGDPAVKGQLNTTYRANSDVITRETLTFNIAAEIADIRPNGSLVIEAHKSITNNDNRWEVSLSGICQADDIGPDNVVLSRNLIDLKIDKRESGQARDGYRRGWFTEFISRFQPF